MSDSVIGILLNCFALAMVAFVIWGGYRETSRAEREYAERVARDTH
jgi:hypothetical protein